MESIDGPGEGGCWTVRGARRHDRPENCAWGITVDGCPEVNQSINPAVDRDISSVAFHDTSVQVEQAS